eukprot:SAG31_NODE_1178_length_9531_cov_3.040818_3_plen_59_part_00
MYVYRRYLTKGTAVDLLTAVSTALQIDLDLELSIKLTCSTVCHTELGRLPTLKFSSYS